KTFPVAFFDLPKVVWVYYNPSYFWLFIRNKIEKMNFSLKVLKKLISKEKEEGKTIIFVSHIVNEIESLADNIVFMVEGKLTFAGTIIDLKVKAQRESLEDAIICLLNS
ncbi:MAG: hypothetical protein ACK4FT_04885, partial [Sulfurihydrogenibium azorense]